MEKLTGRKPRSSVCLSIIGASGCEGAGCQKLAPGRASFQGLCKSLSCSTLLGPLHLSQHSRVTEDQMNLCFQGYSKSLKRPWLLWEEAGVTLSSDVLMEPISTSQKEAKSHKPHLGTLLPHSQSPQSWTFSLSFPISVLLETLQLETNWYSGLALRM